MEILGSLLQGYTPILLFILICFAALLVMFYKVVRSLDDVARTVTQDRESLHESVRQISDMLVMLARKQVEVGNALQKLGESGVATSVDVAAKPSAREAADKREHLDAALAMAAGAVFQEAAFGAEAAPSVKAPAEPRPEEPVEIEEEDYVSELLRPAAEDEADHIASSLSLGHDIEEEGDEEDFGLGVAEAEAEAEPELPVEEPVEEDEAYFLEPSIEDLDEALIAPPEEEDEEALIEPPEDEEEDEEALMEPEAEAPVFAEPVPEAPAFGGAEVSEEELDFEPDLLEEEAEAEEELIFTLAEDEEPAEAGMPEPGLPEEAPLAPEEEAMHVAAGEDEDDIDFTLDTADEDAGEPAVPFAGEAEEEEIMLLDEPIQPAEPAMPEVEEPEAEKPEAEEPEAEEMEAGAPETEPLEDAGVFAAFEEAGEEEEDEDELVLLDETDEEELEIIVESRQAVDESDLLIEGEELGAEPGKMIESDEAAEESAEELGEVADYEETMEFDLGAREEALEPAEPAEPAESEELAEPEAAAEPVIPAAAAEAEEEEFDLGLDEEEGPAEEDMFSDSLGIVPEIFDEEEPGEFAAAFDEEAVEEPGAEPGEVEPSFGIPGLDEEEDEDIVFEEAGEEAGEEAAEAPLGPPSVVPGPPSLDTAEEPEEVEDLDATVEFDLGAPEERETAMAPEGARSEPMEAFSGMDEAMLDVLNQEADLAFDEDEEEEIDLDADLHAPVGRGDYGLQEDVAKVEEITPEDEADISFGEALAGEDEFTLSDDEPSEQHVDIAHTDEVDQELDVLIEDLMDVDVEQDLPGDEVPDYETEIVLEDEEEEGDEEPETVLDIPPERPRREAPPSVISMDDEEEEEELTFSLAGEDEDVTFTPPEEEQDLEFSSIDEEDVEEHDLTIGFDEEEEFSITSEADTGEDLDQTMPDISPTLGGGPVEELDLSDLDIVIEPGGSEEEREGALGDTHQDEELEPVIELDDDVAEGPAGPGTSPRKPAQKSAPAEDDFEIDFMLDDEEER